MSAERTNENDVRERYHVPGLARALKVVEFLAQQGSDGATLADLTNALGYPKNSLFRITTTLHDMGYVLRSGDPQKFRLSRKFLYQGLVSMTDHNLVEHSIDIMRELRDTLGISTFLGILHEDHGITVEQVPGGHPFKLAIDPGTPFNLHASAPGKALLAYLPEGELEKRMRILDLQRYTPNTITTVKGLSEELLEVRARGYAFDEAESFESVHCVGAPIFDYSNRPVAALWISGASVVLPVKRFDECGRIVAESAHAISVRLGYFNS